MSIERHFLERHQPGLADSPEVQAAVERENQMAEGLVDDWTPDERIGIYMWRLEQVFDHPIDRRRERLSAVLRQRLVDHFVIKSSDIPNSYYEQKLYPAEGELISRDQQAELADELIARQTDGLDSWLEFITSQEATYPPYLKYWIFTSAMRLGSYDPESKHFPHRDENSTDDFPELNPEAIALLCDIVERNELGKAEVFIQRHPELEELLQHGSFADLYAFAYNQVQQEMEQREVASGAWKRFDQGSDPEQLLSSLEDKGTGWVCSASLSFAAQRLACGDIYVYFSADTQGEFTQPRACILMSGSEIEAVHGAGNGQEMAPELLDVIHEKCQELPGGEFFGWQERCTRTLDELERWVKTELPLAEDDLFFLMGGYGRVQTFSGRAQSRVRELLKGADGLDDDFAQRLLDAGADDNLREHLAHFTNLSERTLQRLLGASLAAAPEAKLFSGQHSAVVIEKLKHFTGLSEETACALIDASPTNIPKVVSALPSFEQLGNVVAERLFQNNFGWAVLFQREVFSRLTWTDDELANRLLDSRWGYLVAENESTFQGLSEATRERIAIERLANNTSALQEAG
jgi:hypothetical protein